ncbi:MAG: hypothetical protein FOGNACKC_00759 [Anaerolineae bacterium]|nr:hypothetical protein [Anaerolineae bacterium]
MDKATISALRDFLLKIYEEQKSDWSEETYTNRKPSDKARDFYTKYIYNMWHQVDEREFEKLLNKSSDKLEVDFSATKTVLFLPPLEKDGDFVPILNIKCKITEAVNSLRFYVLLVRLGEAGQKPYGLAFRFESPENEHYEKQTKDEGLHDFYHAQLITGFSYGPDLEIPPWVPDSQPSFPLLADDPLTLVFAMLMTLYGKKYCWEFYRKHATNLPELGLRIKKLHTWVKWKAFDER